MTVRRHGAHPQSCARCIPSCTGRIPSCSGRTPCRGRIPCARCSPCFSCLSPSLRRRSSFVEVDGGHLVDRAAVEAAVTSKQTHSLQMIHCRAHSARRHAAALADGGDGGPAHALVVGLVCQRNQHSLLRDAQALQWPALRHDDGRHVRAPASCFRPAQPATRCRRCDPTRNRASSGRAKHGRFPPARGGGAPAHNGTSRFPVPAQGWSGQDGASLQTLLPPAGHPASRIERCTGRPRDWC